MTQVSPPTFAQPHVPPLIVQAVSSVCFVSSHSVFILIRHFCKSLFKKKKEIRLSVLHNLVPYFSLLSIYPHTDVR